MLDERRAGERADESQRDRSSLGPPQVPDCRRSVTNGGQDPLGERQQRLASVGQPGTGSVSLEQGRFQLSFEQIDPAADRRLRYAKRLTRGGERFHVGDHHEGLEFCQFHDHQFS